jgi:capsular polysaccharide biosynthesis protein
MQETQQLDFTFLLRVLKDHFKQILIITSIVAAFSVYYALSLPNIYEAKAIVKFSKNNNQNLDSGGADFVSTIFSGLGGAAEDKHNTMQKLKSRDFFNILYKDNDFARDLMAFEAVGQTTNKYNKKIYDAKNNIFIENARPTESAAYRSFLASHIEVASDRETGLVTVSILHQSPVVAQRWVAWMIDEINLFIKEAEKRNALLAYEYLEKKILTSPVSELRKVNAALMQQQLAKLMFAEVSKDFALEYVDRASIPDIKSKPSRAIICILFTFFGGLGAFLYFYIREIISITKSS